jgi:hypothetical protein
MTPRVSEVERLETVCPYFMTSPQYQTMHSRVAKRVPKVAVMLNRLATAIPGDPQLLKKYRPTVPSEFAAARRYPTSRCIAGKATVKDR